MPTADARAEGGGGGQREDFRFSLRFDQDNRLDIPDRNVTGIPGRREPPLARKGHAERKESVP